MENIRMVHCFFEQSGTFKNEFIKLGIHAEDYDIQNNFGQTDNMVDLFGEIENGYDGKPSVFDNIRKEDLIMAFFPCIYFEAMQMTYYIDQCINLRNLKGKEKFDAILQRISNRDKFYTILRKLVFVCELRHLRLVIENPATQPHYLLFTQNSYAPTFIDKNRTLRGDNFVKPTAYWFFGCKPTYGKSYHLSKDIQRIKYVSNRKSKPGLCNEARSMITPMYAYNFICDFIVGRENEYTERTLF